MARATGDILPDSLIHKILSYLNPEEAAPMKIISKTWLQAWLMTKANLVFEVHSRKHIRIVDKIMEIYRDRKFPIDKFIFQSVREFDSREVFLLFDKWLGVALQNGVKDLVFRVPGFSYHFPIFKVLASKSLRKL
ncbi:hypothetical protein A4A49_13918 [Nicotiana attenuata]|uniref:F-box domain-containing protein n=1 Tax=Nicotiana attenuata TaxID=49451 RepID=A0A314L2S3_NICAT|nr:hypothetical protein A4A49_13918 [Nicotiana attenuata]